MKNNNGWGLYEIGEESHLSCGCIIEAQEIGYIHYIHPNCDIDNQLHQIINGYQYLPMTWYKGVKDES